MDTVFGLAGGIPLQPMQPGTTPALMSDVPAALPAGTPLSGVGAPLSVLAGIGLTGGGSMPLGGAVTLSVAPVIPQTETIKTSDGGTTNSATCLVLYHHGTGSAPAAGFGSTMLFDADYATGGQSHQAQLSTDWTDATNRRARLSFYAYNGLTSTALFAYGYTAGGVAALGFFSNTLVAQQTGDVAAAMNAYGLMTSASYAANALPVFVAAGGSHAQGAVPDPGVTAHTNFPFFLGDDATFHKPIGTFVGTPQFVATIETTTSATAADLATVMSITFTLDVAGSVWISVGATHSNNTANATNSLYATVDGTANKIAQGTCPTANNNYNMGNSFLATGLAAGAHTVKMQFSTNAGTASFSNRSFCMELLP